MHLIISAKRISFRSFENLKMPILRGALKICDGFCNIMLKNQHSCDKMSVNQYKKYFRSFDVYV